MQEALDEFLCQWRDILVAVLRIGVGKLELSGCNVGDCLHVAVTEEGGHSRETVYVCVGCVCVCVDGCVCVWVGGGGGGG